MAGEYFTTIQQSIGEKFSSIIFCSAIVAGGLAIAFYQGPVFAALCLAYFPVVIFALAIFGRQVKKTALDKIEIQKKLGGIVEESLSAIRLIASFAREEKEI
jgi:subfamily B ATP-binding cassette protein MsbA